MIYDEDDRQSLVKEALRELDFDERTLTPSTVVHRISHCKNQMLSPADVERLARTPREERLASLYRLYEEKLQAAGALDFDDLLLRVVRLLETVPEALRWYRTVWTATCWWTSTRTPTAPQYRIVQRLAEEHRNLCVVGDPDQSIYAGAAPISATSSTSRRTTRDAAVVRARAELPLHQAHPRHRLRGDRQQHRAQGQAALDREPRGRAGGSVYRAWRRERGGRLRGPEDPGRAA